MAWRANAVSMTVSDLHPIVVSAAEGRLPEWAQVSDRRRQHLASVAELLTRWADELGLDETDRVRWSAAGWLHDALRNARGRDLAEYAADYPKRIRHGPAVAERLRREGVDDPEILEAVAYHSIGRGGLSRLGRFLFLADYLEPGRPYAPLENAVLRARLPGDEVAVLKVVCARRIAELLDHGKTLRAEAIGFWNELVASR